MTDNDQAPKGHSSSALFLKIVAFAVPILFFVRGVLLGDLSPIDVAPEALFCFAVVWGIGHGVEQSG